MRRLTHRVADKSSGTGHGTKDHISGKHFDCHERERVKHVFARPSPRSVRPSLMWRTHTGRWGLSLSLPVQYVCVRLSVSAYTPSYIAYTDNKGIKVCYRSRVAYVVSDMTFPLLSCNRCLFANEGNEETTGSRINRTTPDRPLCRIRVPIMFSIFNKDVYF